MFACLLSASPLLLAWLGCFGLCRELAARKKIPADWRISWMLACVAWGTILTFITEFASALRALGATAVWVGWVGGGVVLSGTAIRLARRRGVWSKAAFVSASKRISLDWKQNWPLDARLMLFFTAFLVAALGLIAAVTPTTNWDSLTYHLPRVMHWIQQGSVDHYASNNTCQIEYGPWSAFAVATLHLLCGNDRLDNLVQWFAMLSCLIVCSLIAEELFRNTRASGRENDPGTQPAKLRRLSTFAALLVATLPIGIVESITTQVDYVVTFWLATLAGLLLRLRREPTNFLLLLGAGLALGLGVFTKVTMFVYAAPFGVATLCWLLGGVRGNQLKVRIALVFALAFLAVNGPHLLRNYGVFGSPLGSRGVDSVQRNKNVSLSGTLSNVIRGLALQTNTGIEPLTQALNETLLWLHRFTGRDLNDPDTTFQSGRFGVLERFLIFDSYASNFYHLLLAMIAAFTIFGNPKRHLSHLVYLTVLVGGYALFCALLRWQQWHGRLHIAWMVLLIPWTASLLAEWRRRWLEWAAAAGVFVFAVVCLISNASRPVLNRGFMALPREQQYLATTAPLSYRPLAQTASDIVASGCDEVGIKLDYDDPEYALWILLRNRGYLGRIDHAYVENESDRIRRNPLKPCAVLTSQKHLPASVTAEFGRQSHYDRFTVLWGEP